MWSAISGYRLKRRPNDRNILTQHIATLLGATCCPRLATLLRGVTRCGDMLGVVGSNLKLVKFSCNICGCGMMLWSFGQVRATMLYPGMRTSSIFNTRHVATPRKSAAKRTQHVAPNNVPICCAEILRSFGRCLQMLGQQCWDTLC